MGFLRNDTGPAIPTFGGEAFPWIGGDAQTLRHFIRRDAPAAPPGETVILDLDDGDQLLAAYHQPDTAPRGTIIAVHGLNGCMDAAHILWLTPSVLASGYALLRINMRGAGPGRSMAKGTYNAGAGADLLPFVDWAAGRHPGLPIVMMAHSLGGTAALNMALDYPDRLAALTGLVTICAPLDMTATAARFHAPRNWLYIRYMLAGMKRIAAGVPDLDPALARTAQQVRSVYEFDDRITAPLAGYRSAADYYRGTSVHDRLDDLDVPVMILQSSNDPWIPAGPALHPPQRRGGASIVVTKGGGHVGFHDAGRNWHIRATLAWADHLAQIQDQAGRII